MRYDIEINITDVLTDTGKKKVTDMLLLTKKLNTPAWEIC